MSEDKFALQGHLDFLYETKPRRLEFRARTLAEFQQWQQELRAEVMRLLGLSARLPIPVSAEKLETTDRGDYLEEKFALEVGEQVRAPMYLLVPRQSPPYRPILAFHGHEPSVQYILGNYPEPGQAQAHLAAHNNYAQALAQAGYLVCAVEQRGFGERKTNDSSGGPFPRSCRHLAVTTYPPLSLRATPGGEAISYPMRGLLSPRCARDMRCARNDR